MEAFTKQLDSLKEDNIDRVSAAKPAALAKSEAEFQERKEFLKQWSMVKIGCERCLESLLRGEESRQQTYLELCNAIWHAEEQIRSRL